MNRPTAALNLTAGAVRVGRSAQARPRQVDFRRLRLRLYCLIILMDAVSLLAAFVVADFARFGSVHGYGLTTFAILFPTYVAIGLNGDSLSIESLRRPRHSAAAATRALLLAIAVATILFFSLKVGAQFSRLVFGSGSCLSLLLLAGGRILVGRSIGEHYGWTFRREVLLCDGVRIRAAGTEIVVHAAKDGLEPDSDDPAMLDRLARVLDGAERAIVGCPPERREAWARMLGGANVDVEILTPELDSIGALGLRRYGEVPTLLVGRGPLGLRDRALKRAFDLGFSAASLVLLSPVLLAAAAAIKIDSPGPVLFRQVRMGRGNRLFEVLKLRTMRIDSADPHGTRSVSRDDARVTRIGRLLRASSIDELPQLINVLKGEMSIVGPRPHALGTRAGDRLLWVIDERYWDRHAIKPGLTGLAQVRGLRGETVRKSDLTDRLKADLEYLDGWHIGRDLAIIARTFGVLVHPNAF
ncbi:MAG TPA: sugar transferase [Sphingomicrobium sp.]|nr:sugar transferase [Sphingomicrobium sp.]